MFHNVEVVSGASPYARNDRDVTYLVESLDGLFAHLFSAYRTEAIGLSRTRRPTGMSVAVTANKPHLVHIVGTLKAGGVQRLVLGSPPRAEVGLQQSVVTCWGVAELRRSSALPGCSVATAHPLARLPAIALLPTFEVGSASSGGDVPAEAVAHLKRIVPTSSIFTSLRISIGRPGECQARQAATRLDAPRSLQTPGGRARTVAIRHEADRRIGAGSDDSGLPGPGRRPK